MIRAATLLWAALASLVGIGLFQLKHEVQALDEELVRLNRQIAAEHQTVHVLKAEWSYFNQPQRLEQLAQRHLDLAPMKPRQLARIADLPRRPAEDADVIASPSPRPTASPVGTAVSSAPHSGAAPASSRAVPARPRGLAIEASAVAHRPPTALIGPR